MIYENSEKLMDACKEWQKVLRLQDWTISASIERGRDISMADVQGECNWTIQSKMAKIKVLDATDYEDSLMVEQDMEKTLVHELLHLHAAPFDNFAYNSLENTSLEQAIDAIANALVNTKREANDGHIL